MISLAKELHQLFRQVQRCEIAAQADQTLEVPELGTVQPSELAHAVQRLLTQAALAMRSLDELVAKGNPQAPIDIQERLVHVLCEQPDQPPMQL
jgi:hypothetical protein